MNITLTQLIITVAIAVSIPTLTALIGILVSNGRFNDLSKRIDDMGSRVNDVSSNMLQHRSEIHSDIQMLIGWERERMGGGRA
jgi:tetrahydromethanopterin S-methyltransferase subunit G